MLFIIYDPCRLGVITSYVKRPMEYREWMTVIPIPVFTQTFVNTQEISVLFRRSCYPTDAQFWLSETLWDSSPVHRVRSFIEHDNIANVLFLNLWRRIILSNHGVVNKNDHSDYSFKLIANDFCFTCGKRFFVSWKITYNMKER